MCGRYGFSVQDAQEVYDRFEIETINFELKPRYNIAPGQVNPVIISHSPNELTGMFWGLIPAWAKDINNKYKTINARVEGIEAKPSFRKPLQFQRCLVPATGFYEWDSSTKPKTPYYFKLKNDEMFAFAGIYDIWKNPKTGKEIFSYSIITTEANDILRPLHHRMPVILKKEDEEAWLNSDETELDRIKEFLYQYPADEMETYPVSNAVNIVTNDSADLIKPENSK